MIISPKIKSIEAFADESYENALFFESLIGVNLYKNRSIILCIKMII